MPTSIKAFCAGAGLSKYADMMEENEIDLDVLKDLAEEDWEEMGVAVMDMPRLLQVCMCMCV
jgi:hypothetical protein